MNNVCGSAMRFAAHTPTEASFTAHRKDAPKFSKSISRPFIARWADSPGVNAGTFTPKSLFSIWRREQGRRSTHRLVLLYDIKCHSTDIPGTVWNMHGRIRVR